jgi:hypothetical protein
LALPVSVIVRQRRAKFLLPGPSQLQNPVREGAQAFLSQNPFHSMPAQIGAYTQRSLAPGRMIGHEVLREAPIIE